MKYGIYFFILIFISCGQETPVTPTKAPEPLNPKEINKESEKLNKYLTKEERYEIDNFVKRRNWEMIETKTGLRYMIYEKGSKTLIKSGERVVLDFKISLLNGTVCYDSKESGSEEFVVDHDLVESGLHEVMKYLHEGDKAKVIIPSHLAYGLTGDMNKIPPYSTVVYDLTVLEVGNSE